MWGQWLQRTKGMTGSPSFSAIAILFTPAAKSVPHPPLQCPLPPEVAVDAAGDEGGKSALARGDAEVPDNWLPVSEATCALLTRCQLPYFGGGGACAAVATVPPMRPSPAPITPPGTIPGCSPTGKGSRAPALDVVDIILELTAMMRWV